MEKKVILSLIGIRSCTVRGVIFAVAALLVMLAAGCGDGGTSVVPVSTTAPTSAAPSEPAKAVLATSEMVVGDERFVLGLLDPKTGQPINYVPDVNIQFFKVNDDGTATKTSDATPIYRSENLPAGVYVSRTTFTEPGKWGAIVTIKPQGRESYQQKLDFEVLQHGTVPIVGDPAPPSKNQTVRDPDIKSIGEICSAQPPDDMHDLTIADAIKSGKPTVILIAAPGFCPSFTCGPDLEMVQKLKQKYGDKANFIHIEAPNTIQNHTHTGPVDPNHHQEPGHQGVDKPQVKTAEEWGLKSEPWLFFVDKDGKIADRFEGGLTYDEVEPRLAKVVQ
ncbi:MAG TPA: hypothetical protein VJ183_18420 [Chloroflexia bacterium]|nr:hypothetical protein [Chloroflexia bacterium]